MRLWEGTYPQLPCRLLQKLWGDEERELEEALQNALCNTLNFTPQDLLWNRQGTLSPAQREILLRKVRSGMRWSLFFLPVSIAGTVALFLFAPDLPVLVGALLGGGWCLSSAGQRAEKTRGNRAGDHLLERRVCVGAQNLRRRFESNVLIQAW